MTRTRVQALNAGALAFLVTPLQKIDLLGCINLALLRQAIQLECVRQDYTEKPMGGLFTDRASALVRAVTGSRIDAAKPRGYRSKAA